MDYISDLGNSIRAAMAVRRPADATGPVVGTISGDHVLISGQYYRIVWGGDFDVTDGQDCDCVVGDGICVVVGVR